MQLEKIGFPEGQLVANGLGINTAYKVGVAFRAGKDMRAAVGDAELTPVLDRIIDRLEQHSQWGKPG